MFPERSEAKGRRLPSRRTVPTLPTTWRRYDTKAGPSWGPPRYINGGGASPEAIARPRSSTRPSLRPAGESAPPWRSITATATRYRPSAARERPPPSPASAKRLGRVVSRRPAAPRAGVRRPPSPGPPLPLGPGPAPPGPGPPPRGPEGGLRVGRLGARGAGGESGPSGGRPDSGCVGWG